MGNPIMGGCPYQCEDGFNDRNRFPHGHMFVGEIENGKRYPFGVYTKEESDALYAVKQTEDDLADLADVVSQKADESECVDIRARLDALEEEMRTYVTPEMFGAVGDGETDDSTAFQNAVNRCISTNETLLISKSYKIRGITITGAINICGLNDNRCKLLDFDGDTPMFTCTNANYTNFSNFYINFVADRTVPLFDISNSHSTVFDRIWINASAYSGSPTVPTIKIYKSGSATTYLTRIRECKFIFASVYLESTDSIIENNAFNGRYCNYTLHLHRSDNTIISGNEIVPGINSAIHITSPYNVEGIKIIGNYFDGGMNADITGCAITSETKLSHAVISSNNFWKVKKHGIHLDGIIYSNICDNVFQECGFTDQTLDDILIDKLSYGLNINSNNFFRSNWYTNGELVSRDSHQCYYIKFDRLAETAVQLSHMIGNIVNDIRLYNKQDYGDYFVTWLNANEKIPENVEVTLNTVGNYIEAVPSCRKSSNDIVIINGAFVVENEIPLYEPVISGCPAPSEYMQGIVFNEQTTRSVYVDDNGYLHCGALAAI